MAWVSWSRTWATRSTTKTTSRKPQRYSSKNLCWKRMYLLLRTDQSPKHKTKTYFCLLINKNCTYLWKKMDWCRARNLFAYRLPSGKKIEYSSSSWSSTSRRRWSDWILEIKRLSAERILSTLNIGLMKCGRVIWQEAEATRKDFNIVLIHQDKKFFISELFKVIWDAIWLILRYRTMH